MKDALKLLQDNITITRETFSEIYGNYLSHVGGIVSNNAGHFGLNVIFFYH